MSAACRTAEECRSPMNRNNASRRVEEVALGLCLPYPKPSVATFKRTIGNLLRNYGSAILICKRDERNCVPGGKLLHPVGNRCAKQLPYRFPPCVGYKPNEWMTFQVRTKIGKRYKNDKVYHRDSAIQLFGADEGKPSK